MAFVNNQDEEAQNQFPTTGGSTVLAGSGGAGASSGPTSPAGQTVGTGFTNLQKYLTANQGQGAGIANDMVANGQKAVEGQMQMANQSAITWGDAGVDAANKAGAQQSSQVQQAVDYTNSGASDYIDQTADARVKQYQKPADNPTNELERGYANVKNAAALHGNDFNTQKAGLQQKHNYGSGFASLDTFLGKQDAGSKLSTWQNQVNTGLVNDQGVYKGIAEQQARVASANQQNQTGFDTLKGYLGTSVADRQKAEADSAAAAAKAKADADARAAALKKSREQFAEPNDEQWNSDPRDPRRVQQKPKSYI
ncbi:MAG TPA: hypothetical protein VE954_36365 [Oligoflexus sp.]|uniref:hypothetical protein n=1 Tax=Oligoflexus sp. TaxID=1971216 RepID=UPI002D5A200E|nr:hypothetical protein [Oligoflexus sp.]HYX38610.1 hypothetical protein [Oligoflexus sp.]